MVDGRYFGIIIPGIRPIARSGWRDGEGEGSVGLFILLQLRLTLVCMTFLSLVPFP